MKVFCDKAGTLHSFVFFGVEDIRFRVEISEADGTSRGFSVALSAPSKVSFLTGSMGRATRAGRMAWEEEGDGVSVGHSNFESFSERRKFISLDSGQIVGQEVGLVNSSRLELDQVVVSGQVEYLGQFVGPGGGF